MGQKVGYSERHHNSAVEHQRLQPAMPTGTIVFKCIRINLKRNSTFEPDESCIDSLIEFDLKIGHKSLRGLKAVVRQLNGTDFQSQPLKVGNVIGYEGPWNDEEFKETCGRYYRDIIGSSGIGLAIHRGERNLVERVAIKFHQRQKINLPASDGAIVHLGAGQEKNAHHRSVRAI
jgi:hypothetical protein